MKYAKGQFYIKFTKTIVDYKTSKTWIYQLFIKKSVTRIKYKSTTRVQLYKSTRKKWHNHSGHQQIDNWHSPCLYFSISFFQRVGIESVKTKCKEVKHQCANELLLCGFFALHFWLTLCFFDLGLAQSQVYLGNVSDLLLQKEVD